MRPEPADPLIDRLRLLPTVERRGRVVRAIGTTLTVSGIDAAIGQTCAVEDAVTGHRLLADVVGFGADGAILTPLGRTDGVSRAAEVRVLPDAAMMPAGNALLGRVVDAMGNPLDGLGPLGPGAVPVPLFAPAPDPLARPPIAAMLETGIAAIDALTPIGVGQRVGIFAPAGTGKSTLAGMLARFARADVIVIALIGERGREVREFLDDNLGGEALTRAVLVVATSDRPAMERVRAAHAATAIAEGFRAAGRSVLFLMDSVTRFARALREIGLAAGEPAVRRGFTPSVFAELPQLFERTGRTTAGAITAFYTVLLEDEEGGDPIAEEVRSLLDGHLILARRLAEAGRWPAIDALASLSRLMPRLASPAHIEAAAHVRALMARHADVALLVQLGDYQPGTDPLADRALALMPQIEALLRQPSDHPIPADTTIARLRALMPAAT